MLKGIIKKKRVEASDRRWQGNMTEGNPFSLMIRFALPLFIGNLFQLFYNLVDSIVVGNYVGKSALAAVGACATPSYLFVSLSLGFASGAMLYVVFGEILPQAILMYHSKLPAFSVIAGILLGMLIIYI